VSIVEATSAVWTLPRRRRRDQRRGVSAWRAVARRARHAWWASQRAQRC